MIIKLNSTTVDPNQLYNGNAKPTRSSSFEIDNCSMFITSTIILFAYSIFLMEKKNLPVKTQKSENMHRTLI